MDGDDPMTRPKFKLAKMDGPLGDLSGMSVAERAELVTAQGRQRILEERARYEATIWRNACLAWSLFAGGFLMLWGLQESADNWSLIRKSWLGWVWGTLCFVAAAAMVLSLPLILHSSFHVIRLIWRKARGR
ncbi:hypothetical protein ACFQY0_09485 [Haloferula chungangensis]|uniref:Uncharacterized protein n=1 Tax=Haloferula chungangensis TaxID=1048331 RepID=A0ABW2L768_9BACT